MTHKKHMVAVCDILGFADRVRSRPLDEVVTASLGWFLKAMAHSLHKNGFPEGPPALPELRKHPLIGFDWFSDTVLLYTREDTDDHCRELCATIAWLTFETMLRSDVRVRCGLAYGEAHIDEANGIYVGRPIVEAHELEKAQIWAGGAFTESAVNRLPQIARDGQAFDWFVVPYRVPLKREGGAANLAIDWTKGIHSDFHLLWSPSRDEPTEEDWETSRGLCEKWRNTVAFHNEVCFWCRRKEGTQQPAGGYCR